MNVGQRLITAYFVLFYLVPLVGNSVFGEKIETIYTVAPVTPYAILLLVGVFVLCLIMSRGPRVAMAPALLVSATRNTAKLVGGAYRRQRLPLAIVSLPFSVQHFVSGASGYRYLTEGVSEADSLFLLLIVVLNLIVTVDLFFCMFVRRDERPPFLSRRYVENVLLSLVLVITASGTAGMLVGLASMVYSLWPSWFHRSVFLPKYQGILRKTGRAVITAALAIMVFGVSWMAGETIKMSTGERYQDLVSASDALLEVVRETPGFYENFGYHLISAISSHYYSLLFTADAPRDLLNAGTLSPLVHPLQSLAFRLDYLTGGMLEVPRPEYGSLSRLNYVVLTSEPVISLRQGTSPGLIASFNYVFISPFNILFCAIYLCLIARLTNSLLLAHQHKSLSGLGLVLLLFYMLVLFQSPFDFLILLDNAVIYTVLLIGTAIIRRRPSSTQSIANTPSPRAGTNPRTLPVPT